MSKILKLQEWFTLSNAAKYLSKKLDEEVGEADILRLGLDRQLTLSVYFANHIPGLLGEIKTCDNQRKEMLPASEGLDKETLVLIGDFFVQLEGRGKYVEAIGEIIVGVEITGDRITGLKGVWDLPLLGGETTFVENLYMNHIGGPALTGVYLDGSFVRKPDGTFYQLQERFDENHVQKLMASENHKELNEYFPACCLPEGSVLVVRTEVLNAFVQKMLFGGGRPDNKSTKTIKPQGKVYRNLTEQRDEYLKESYDLLCEKVLEPYRGGVMQPHHKATKLVYEAYEREKYNQEIIEVVGGLPKRKLSCAQLRKEVVKQMRIEGFEKWIFGDNQT